MFDMDFGEFLFWCGMTIVMAMAMTVGVLLGWLVFDFIFGGFRK